MAFPSTPLLDDFNRADENPVAGGWASTKFDPGGAQMKIVSNQLVPVAGFGGAYWNTLVHGDCEVYGTCVTSGTPLIGLRLRNPNTASFSGYKLVSSAGSLKIIRVDNGAETTLGAVFGTAASNGDVLGLTIRGSILEGWQNGVSLGQRSDATYGVPGFIFVGTDSSGTAQVWDNFGGGSISDIYTPHGMGTVLH